MLKKIFFLLLLFHNILSTDQYYCTASDAKYYENLLNLIGSIHHTNFENLKEIAVFNLGLNQNQINYLNSIEKVNVYEIEKTHPNILKQFTTHNSGKTVPGWYAWKFVAIKQSLEKFPYVLWIDAGLGVLRPLNDLFEFIKSNGYFLCTAGDRTKNNKYLHSVRWQTTKYVIEKFKLNTPERKWVLEQETLLGGFIGFAKNNHLVKTMYDFSKNDLKMFEDDGSTPEGFGTARHDQSIATILAYLNGYKILKQDSLQQNAMLLNVHNQEFPFYIIWSSDHVNEKTHIFYSTRWDNRYNNFFKQFIKLKTLEQCNIKKLPFFPAKNSSNCALNYNFLKLLKNIFNVKIFVETGTCYGATTAIASNIFNEIHTIELDQNLFEQAKEKFKHIKKITVYHGNSKNVLPDMLTKIHNEKILFFLDAHWSGCETAKGEENTPVLSELRSIKENNIKNSVIIIDDIRLYQSDEIVKKQKSFAPNDQISLGYPSVENLQKIILEINPLYEFIIYGDMLICYLKTENIEISPIIKAMTISRTTLIEDEELIKNEELIGKATDKDKEGITNLMHFVNHPEMFSFHYRLWNGLIFLTNNEYEKAAEQFNKLISLGFNFPRFHKYLEKTKL